MSKPLYKQLYHEFKSQIEAGTFQGGTRLPSIRQLIRETGYSRTTVEAAYEQLCADGLALCVPQSGYYVSGAPQRPLEKSLPEKKDDSPVLFDFSGKQMDPKTFDFDIWRRLSRSVMQSSSSFLGYGDIQGESVLRRQIARYLSVGRGVYATEENVVIGAGVQSLLHILCEMLPKEGMRIAFETPGFQKGYHIFKDHGYQAVFIKGSLSGIDISDLYSSGANAVYISPSHSFPSGAALPYEKRIALMQWAKKVHGAVFEDDYDGELRYSGRPLATLASLDEEGRVFYLGTFSKLLPPSIRISYAVLPNRLLPAYRRIAGRYNQTSSTMEQLTMARFIEEGRLERQIRRLRRIYSRKNAAITAAFQQYFGKNATISPNDTGLHMIVSLKLPQTAEKLCQLALQNGVRLIPMQTFHLEGGAAESAELYLSCAGVAEEAIGDAVAHLYKAWIEKD